MATNFVITQRRRKDGLHLNLCGEFDGSSAFELKHCLETVLQQNRRVFVHTESLTQLPIFGRDVFQKQFGLHPRAVRWVVFTGAYAPDIAPEGCATREYRSA